MTETRRGRRWRSSLESLLDAATTSIVFLGGGLEMTFGNGTGWRRVCGSLLGTWCKYVHRRNGLTDARQC